MSNVHAWTANSEERAGLGVQNPVFVPDENSIADRWAWASFKPSTQDEALAGPGYHHGYHQGPANGQHRRLPRSVSSVPHR